MRGIPSNFEVRIHNNWSLCLPFRIHNNQDDGWRFLSSSVDLSPARIQLQGRCITIYEDPVRQNLPDVMLLIVWAHFPDLQLVHHKLRQHETIDHAAYRCLRFYRGDHLASTNTSEGEGEGYLRAGVFQSRELSTPYWQFALRLRQKSERLGLFPMAEDGSCLFGIQLFPCYLREQWGAEGPVLL